MRFLLLFVSWIFWIVFYLFYSLSQGKNIFWETIYNSFNFQPFIFSLFVTSIIFFLIWSILFIAFSDFRDDYSRLREQKKDFTNWSAIILSIIFLYWCYYWLNYFKFDILSKIYITFFSFILLFLFSYLLWKNWYKTSWLFIKLISVLVLYLWNFYALYFSINYWYDPKISIILAIYIAFNFGLHFKYENLISFLFAIITSISLLYRLYWEFLSWIV